VSTEHRRYTRHSPLELTSRVNTDEVAAAKQRLAADFASEERVDVGRQKVKPGPVVTLPNIHRPRDRSRYERFNVYHRTFYRSVEATSATPFSPRALDRALAAAVVGLCRHSLGNLTPGPGAMAAQRHLTELQELVKIFGQRARA